MLLEKLFKAAIIVLLGTRGAEERNTLSDMLP